MPSFIEEEISVNGLAAAIASEKADSIEEQRPAIQDLGKAKLKELVCCIFECLADGEYNSAEVSARYRLSKATMSRFAGTRWMGSDDGIEMIPDLWRNTAHVLAYHSDFRTAAKKAGVWGKVSMISNNRNSVAGGRHDE
jgi:hypothetical protein